ncbi:MAG: hypothetical protein ACP5P1_08945 [Acidimicrobiales bacterium]
MVLLVSGRAVEASHRDFGERPVGFWSTEFQSAEGRPHHHLLMKGPESVLDARVAEKVRQFGFVLPTATGVPVAVSEVSNEI